MLNENSDANALISNARVHLVQSLQLPPNQGMVVPVHCEGNFDQFSQPLLDEEEQEFEGLLVESATIKPPKDGITKKAVRNDTEVR